MIVGLRYMEECWPTTRATKARNCSIEVLLCTRREIATVRRYRATGVSEGKVKVTPHVNPYLQQGYRDNCGVSPGTKVLAHCKQW